MPTGQPILAGIGLDIGHGIGDTLTITVLQELTDVTDMWLFVGVPQAVGVGQFLAGAIVTFTPIRGETFDHYGLIASRGASAGIEPFNPDGDTGKDGRLVDDVNSGLLEFSGVEVTRNGLVS